MHIVTGGAGMIGSHLVDALVARGEKVGVIDNLSRGTLSNLSKAADTGLVGVRTDIDLRAWPLPFEAEDISEVDAIWHLAAKVTGIQYNRQHQFDMLQQNLAINYSVISSIARIKPKLFVYVSTACVYPHDAPVPTPESAGEIGDPEPTNHGYGVAKWVGEQMVKHLAREYEIPCIIVRFFNAFGERDYYDKETSHVAPALIRRVLEGENPLVVWGSGNQTRALVDAKDIARALVMLYDEVSPMHDFTVNIGHEREVSIRELAETIVKLCGKDIGIEFDTSKPDGYPRRAADTTFLRYLIDWVPDRPLGATLEEMIQEFKEGRAHM